MCTCYILNFLCWIFLTFLKIMGPDGKPTRKVDHNKAVKMYERGQGDKIIPSDLRPSPVLKVDLTDNLESSIIDVSTSVHWTICSTH